MTENVAAPSAQKPSDEKEVVWPMSRESSVYTAVEQREHDMAAKNVKRQKPRAFRTDVYDTKKDRIIDFLAMCILLPPVRGNQ